MIQHYSAIINKEDSLYVAHCPEVDVTSQGATIEEAKKNLQEAIELYIESFGTKEIQYRQPPIMTTVSVEIPENA